MTNPAPRVAIVAGARTPFVKASTTFRHVSALDLAQRSVDGLLDKVDLDPAAIDLLAYGIVVVDPRTPQFGREVVFRSRLPSSVPGHTVTDNCITGTTAIMEVADAIAAGRAEVGIAGGVESMSNPAVLFTRQASRILLDANAERSLGGRLKQLARLRPQHLRPDPPGVAEPSTGLTMGEHTELMVKEWGIPRAAQDELALRSHQRAHAATEDGRLRAEIVPIEGLDHDGLIRGDTSLEKLSRLPPVFDRSDQGTLTAGNSSPLTDGAASILLMSEDRARREGIEPLAFLRGYQKVAIDPADGLLMGPGVAVPDLLRQQGVSLAEVDLVEMHEAFAGQVLCNLAAWEKGWKRDPIGTVDVEKLNVMGSSIAQGHPFAATGIRIASALAGEMKRREAGLGLISICAAGAMASATLLERR